MKGMEMKFSASKFLTREIAKRALLLHGLAFWRGMERSGKGWEGMERNGKVK